MGRKEIGLKTRAGAKSEIRFQTPGVSECQANVPELKTPVLWALGAICQKTPGVSTIPEAIGLWGEGLTKVKLGDPTQRAGPRQKK